MPWIQPGPGPAATAPAGCALQAPRPCAFVYVHGAYSLTPDNGVVLRRNLAGTARVSEGAEGGEAEHCAACSEWLYRGIYDESTRDYAAWLTLPACIRWVPTAASGRGRTAPTHVCQTTLRPHPIARTQHGACHVLRSAQHGVPVPSAPRLHRLAQVTDAAARNTALARWGATMLARRWGTDPLLPAPQVSRCPPVLVQRLANSSER